MYREGKPEQELIKWNKFMKEKVQEKFKDYIMIDKSYSTIDSLKPRSETLVYS